MVIDNGSDEDSELASLRAYANQKGIPLVQSGFRLAANAHGHLLRSFVMDHPEYSHYLFIDPDVYFLSQGTLDRMVAELDAAESAWGIMPRCTWDGESDHSLPDGVVCLGEETLITYSIQGGPWGDDMEPTQSRANIVARLHPFCALIKNTPVFRSVAEHVGLSNACTFSPRDGFNWDTLALTTSVMKTHGLEYLMSTEMVFHFFGVSYDTEWIESKRGRCKKWLDELRAQDAWV
jgi:hypothetical protein